MAAVSNSAVLSGRICEDGGGLIQNPDASNYSTFTFFLATTSFLQEFSIFPSYLPQYFLGSSNLPKVPLPNKHPPIGSVPRLAYASQEMQQDREVVLAAVKHDGTMLQFSSGGVFSRCNDNRPLPLWSFQKR